jgi:hypothetical protein
MRELIGSPSFGSFRGNLAAFALSTFKSDPEVQVEDQDRDTYNASQAAYGSAEHHERLAKRGYKLDEELSTHNTKIYANGDKAIVGYRGTVHDPEDLSADIAIAAGLHTRHPAFWTASAVGERAHKKYKDVTYTGHSLGGTKAIETAKQYGRHAVVFNPGSAPTRKLDTGKAKVYRTSGDYISYNVNAYKPRTIRGTHSLDSFEDLLK